LLHSFPLLPTPKQPAPCLSSTHRCGTGWSGLILAKTYIHTHPDADLAVLEAADSVGGVWARHRLYPGLRTNSILGSYESPDFPMIVDKYGVKPGEHIPGTVVHQYMADFAKTFDIWRRIRFRTKVEEIQQESNGQWILTLTTFQPTDGKETMKTKKIAVDKLIIATGATGNPNMPNIPGADDFDAPLFHAKEFLQKKELLKIAKKVVVYGGSKSAVRIFQLLLISFLPHSQRTICNQDRSRKWVSLGAE
jgi:cation diffusion facilitator CzcD-associated flavoprotein CzcO